MRWSLIIIAVCLPCLAGCSSSSRQLRQWVASQGGLMDGAPEARAQAIGRRVLGLPAGAPVPVHVLRAGHLGAYSWPGGRVYVTRTLLEALDDEQVAAAIAHEAGHLLGHRHGVTSGPPFGTTGDRDLDIEVGADAAGCEILASRGLPPRAMRRLLESLMCAPGCLESCRPALQRRIELLDRRWPRPSE